MLLDHISLAHKILKKQVVKTNFARTIIDKHTFCISLYFLAYQIDNFKFIVHNPYFFPEEVSP